MNKWLNVCEESEKDQKSNKNPVSCLTPQSYVKHLISVTTIELL